MCCLLRNSRFEWNQSVFIRQEFEVCVHVVDETLWGQVQLGKTKDWEITGTVEGLLPR